MQAETLGLHLARYCHQGGRQYNTEAFSSEIADSLPGDAKADSLRRTQQDQPQDRLRVAARHVAEGRLIIAKQRATVARLENSG
jgi:hypothetical protein